MVDPKSIIVSRLDGLGDIVLGSGLLAGLRARYPDAMLKLLVRPQMAGVAGIMPEGVEVILLPFDPRQPVVGSEARIGSEMKELLPRLHADWAICGEYNQVWAGELLLASCGASRKISLGGPSGLNIIHQAIAQELGIALPIEWQTISVESNCHEPDKYKKLLQTLDSQSAALPNIRLDTVDLHRAQDWWKRIGLPPEQTLVIFPGGGDGMNRSLAPADWKQWIEHLDKAGHPMVVLGSPHDQSIVDTVRQTGLPASTKIEFLDANDTALLAGILRLSRAYIGMDTGPMHLSAVQNVPTLGIFGGGHRAHRFLPVGLRSAIVRMPIECYGCDWNCPFTTRLCIREMPVARLIEIGDSFLSWNEKNADPLTQKVFTIVAPVELAAPTIGATARAYQFQLSEHHAIYEHHAYLAGVLSELSRKLAGQNESLARIDQVLAEMTRQNQSRDQAIAKISHSLGAMTEQTQIRDNAIAHLNGVDAEMTRQNQSRDQAIAHLHQVITEMTVQNQSRDRAISSIQNEFSARRANPLHTNGPV